MVGSREDKRTDKELFKYLKEKFDQDWFLCRSSKISRDRLNDLVRKGLLLESREMNTHAIHYKVVK